ncbi:heat shock 70 kDa protein 1-like [Vicia villosa]|uniref:heat shock 70 kDa protein 1-like n=1 Tax=Vicia villosa TaxID=3911 RepID=UPI00273BFB6C|nr:heat shock 70 kDa protein 1-like [Vicia villosa]
MANKYEGCPVGIDLGTTYSCVGLWRHEHKHNRFHIIHNDQDNLITVFDAKRVIGRRFSDSDIQDDMKLPFKVIAKAKSTEIKKIKKTIEEGKKFKLEDKKFLRKAIVMDALDLSVYGMKIALKKGVNLKLTDQEREDINNAMSVAKNLLDKNNQQKKDIDFLEGHLKKMENMLELINAKTSRKKKIKMPRRLLC